MSLFSLPTELLLLLTHNLQYASELSAMSQTCRRFHTIFDPELYSRFANSCEFNILRLVETGNSDAIQKLGLLVTNCLIF
ncbi:F-box domain, cyclin-like [Penicillium roqueforti FM164]|uniref:F-box domain, cyclin-like n=1 Tax=Penicillium roqueforti (strain FM164) TaxID=1365484 RepID=W6R093_PENRF|nr:F-box domain, cyclin-like [Penicillium roqueforti FM164]